MSEEHKKPVTEQKNVQGKHAHKDQRLNESFGTRENAGKEVRKISGIEQWPDPPVKKDGK